MSGAALKRMLPVLKIGVAAALIAMLVWLVPFRDHLVLPSVDPAASMNFAGRILEHDATSARFEIDDAGKTVALELSDWEWVERATLPDGAAYVPPPELEGDKRARLEQGLFTTFRNASIGLLPFALALIFLGNLIAVYRWHLLLQGAGLGISFGHSFSYTFIGTFFNNIMPGLTGGDLVKAVYIARHHPKRKTEAIITVLLDRVLGITGLALVAGLVIPFNLERYGEVAPWIFGLLGFVALFGCMFFSRRVRSMLKVGGVVSKLPFNDLVRKIDQAVFLYRFRQRLLLVSLLLSMVVHLVVIGGIGVMGVALGLDVPFATYFAVVPIGLIAMALPIAPSGWGVGEAAFVFFWGTVGVAKAKALSLALVYRINQFSVSLVGGLCLMMQKDRVSAHDVDTFTHGAEGNDGDGGDSGDGGRGANALSGRSDAP